MLFIKIKIWKLIQCNMILDKFAQLFACKLILRHANRPGKNFCTAPYFIMHAHLINYAFYSLSLNTIDNSLGNWIYTSLIITYCTNKRGFFSRRFFPRCFSLSLSIFPSFSSPVLWRALLTNYPSLNQLSLFFSFFYVTCMDKVQIKTNQKTIFLYFWWRIKWWTAFRFC